MTKHTRGFINLKVDKYLKECLENPGKWVHLTKDNCGINRETIWYKIRDMLKIMGIRHAIETGFPMGQIDYGHGYKIKVLDETEHQSNRS